jgi:hypothetical protein
MFWCILMLECCESYKMLDDKKKLGMDMGDSRPFSNRRRGRRT